MQLYFKIPDLDSGQTLIETLAAIFILVMGITSAVGLAVYAFGFSTSVTKEIIATGLAREGIEAVKNMRDTNWLQQTTINNNCYNYASTTAFNSNCYSDWLDEDYCLQPTGGAGGCNSVPIASSNFIISFDSSDPRFFEKSRSTLNGFQGYGLTFNPTNAGTTGFYSGNPADPGLPCANGATAGGLLISDYCRKIIITKYSTSLGNAVPPYDKDPNFALIKFVTSLGVEKKCPRLLTGPVWAIVPWSWILIYELERLLNMKD